MGSTSLKEHTHQPKELKAASEGHEQSRSLFHKAERRSPKGQRKEETTRKRHTLLRPLWRGHICACGAHEDPCTHSHAHAAMHTHTHPCTHTQPRTHTHAHAHTHSHTRTHTHHAPIQMPTHTAPVHTLLPMLPHTPTHPHTHMQGQAWEGGTHLAPPPPRTKAMALPVSTLARREKSECRSGGLWQTRSYSSTYKRGQQTGPT